MVRIRRLCGVLAVLALVLPFVPGALGLPFRDGWGGHHGAPRYGQAECLSFSLALMFAAALGAVATQSSLPRAVRRTTLPKAVGIAFLYGIVLPPFMGYGA